MATDYRSLTYNGRPHPERPTLEDAQDRRWWLQEGDEAAATISMTIQSLARQQQARADRQAISARLYGNVGLYGSTGMMGAWLSKPLAQTGDRVTFNVIQSACDTVAAKLAKNKPKPLFLTSGGNYRQIRKAKKLNQFTEGIFTENNYHRLSIKVFRDAEVFGTGVIHVFPLNGRVTFERVLPTEILVDDSECLQGKPRQLHRLRLVDRYVLTESVTDDSAWAQDARESILDAPQYRTLTQNALVADLVAVTESWHLPSGPEAEDGRHTFTVGGKLVLSEPWDRTSFPFAFIHWSERLYGFWGQGLVEQLQPLQLEINKLLWVIQRSMQLGASFKIFLEAGSKVVKQHLNNEIGTIISYQGQPPQYVTPPMVPPEVYQHLGTLKAAAYEIAGVSQLSATSSKPAGLNSGKALRELTDIESDRFTVTGQAYEQLALDVARLSIETVREIAGKRSYKVNVPGRKWLQTVDWREIADLDQDAFVLKCYPISSLPQDPAGRLQTIQEYAQAGMINPRQARRLLDFPDLDAVENLQNAAEEYLSSVLDRIVDDGDYQPPEPFDDLQLAHEMALEYYAFGKANELEEERLELLRRFIDQTLALIKQATQPQGPVGPDAANQPQPQANPAPAPVSDLIPNVPAAG